MGKKQCCSEWQFSTNADLRLVVRRAAPQKAQMWFSKSCRTHVGSKMGVFLSFKQHTSHVCRDVQKWYLGIADPPTMYVQQKPNVMFQQSEGIQRSSVIWSSSENH